MQNSVNYSHKAALLLDHAYTELYRLTSVGILEKTSEPGVSKLS